MYICTIYIVTAGPLLYHFADLAKQSSIELSYEEVRKIILKFKFDLLVSWIIDEVFFDVAFLYMMSMSY